LIVVLVGIAVLNVDAEFCAKLPGPLVIVTH
jgi:hypothetical protein